MIHITLEINSLNKYSSTLKSFKKSLVLQYQNKSLEKVSRNESYNFRN